MQMGERSAAPRAANQTKVNRAKLSRRAFLRSVSVVAAGAFVAACNVGRENRPVADLVEPVFSEARIPTLPAVAEVQTLPPELSEFLTLSTLLTGVENLDPALGTIYLQSLQGNA